MSKPNSTRQPAAPSARATIVRAVPGQAAPVAEQTSTVVPLTVSIGAAPANADEVLRYAALGISTHTRELDTFTEGTEGHTARSMASTIAAFNALEGTALTERQGWAFLQAVNMSRAANAARNGGFSSQHYQNAAAFAALGHEAADPNR